MRYALRDLSRDLRYALRNFVAEVRRSGRRQPTIEERKQAFIAHRRELERIILSKEQDR